MTSHAKSLGDWGERLAADHLERTGWTILDRNFRVGRKEIDLVALRGDIVAFVEVKTRRGEAYGHGFDSITIGKRQEIEEVARAWIEGCDQAAITFRFDAISVSRNRSSEPLIEHLEDAWGI